jgi:hypothetical protein
MPVRIGRYKLRRTGGRGSAVTVPEVYMEDEKLSSGNDVELHRLGRLLIVAPMGVSVLDELARNGASI